jgi:hypothetical protein
MGVGPTGSVPVTAFGNGLRTAEELFETAALLDILHGDAGAPPFSPSWIVQRDPGARPDRLK